MHYSKNDSLYELEKIMRGIPNFRARGYGRMVLQSDINVCVKEQPPPGSYTEMVLVVMTTIYYLPLEERVTEYIKERESNPMNYRNEMHKEIFKEAIEQLNQNNLALMSAVYLVTADCKLWHVMRWRIGKNEIKFEHVKLRGISVKGYTLYCAAKDLYLGTKHLSISDLADKELISKKMFALICNAMTIRRFGLKAMELAEEMN